MASRIHSLRRCCEAFLGECEIEPNRLEPLHALRPQGECSCPHCRAADRGFYSCQPSDQAWRGWRDRPRGKRELTISRRAQRRRQFLAHRSPAEQRGMISVVRCARSDATCLNTLGNSSAVNGPPPSSANFAARCRQVGDQRSSDTGTAIALIVRLQVSRRPHRHAKVSKTSLVVDRDVGMLGPCHETVESLVAIRPTSVIDIVDWQREDSVRQLIRVRKQHRFAVQDVVESASSDRSPPPSVDLRRE